MLGEVSHSFPLVMCWCMKDEALFSSARWTCKSFLLSQLNWVAFISAPDLVTVIERQHKNRLQCKLSTSTPPCRTWHHGKYLRSQKIFQVIDRDRSNLWMMWSLKSLHFFPTIHQQTRHGCWPLAYHSIDCFHSRTIMKTRWRVKYFAFQKLSVSFIWLSINLFALVMSQHLPSAWLEIIFISIERTSWITSRIMLTTNNLKLDGFSQRMIKTPRFRITLALIRNMVTG